jgi:hypothetical protein
MPGKGHTMRGASRVRLFNSTMLANYQASALRLTARRASKEGDAQSAGQAFDEALKLLKAADDGRVKAEALLMLAADCALVELEGIERRDAEAQL